LISEIGAEQRETAIKITVRIYGPDIITSFPTYIKPYQGSVCLRPI